MFRAKWRAFRAISLIFIVPRKYNRQRRQLLFLVCLQVSEKSGVMKENCWTVVLVVVDRVFYSHFIISLKKYDMVAKTFLYIVITQISPVSAKI
jgi:hypothetical protein